MRFVPGGTSTAWPLIVSLGMRGGRAGRGRGDDPRARAVNQGFELPSELLDVGDVGPDGAVGPYISYIEKFRGEFEALIDGAGARVVATPASRAATAHA